MDEKKNSIVVIWTSRDRDVAIEVVFPYTLNSKLREWWKDTTLVVWGPSTKLLVSFKRFGFMMLQIQSGYQSSP
ncbi:MAG: hypothetical protein JRJ57_07955 [Deltaproteobacteria bacterium]|nr:hypothetical protein [Deltaproteobacteria bacterium]